MSKVAVVDVALRETSPCAGEFQTRLPADTLESTIRRLKTFSMQHRCPNTLIAVELARDFHAGQRRENGEPYVIHPVNVAHLLIIDGVCDDVVLASALLHDVLEDCPDASPQDFRTNGIEPKVVSIVQLLTKQPGQDTDTCRYYEQIGESQQATLVKLADRYHNLATMIGVFTSCKISEYALETEKYVLPLCRNDHNYSSMHAAVVQSMENRISLILTQVRAASDHPTSVSVGSARIASGF